MFMYLGSGLYVHQVFKLASNPNPSPRPATLTLALALALTVALTLNPTLT